MKGVKIYTVGSELVGQGYGGGNSGAAWMCNVQPWKIGAVLQALLSEQPQYW